MIMGRPSPQWDKSSFGNYCKFVVVLVFISVAQKKTDLFSQYKISQSSIERICKLYLD